MRVEIPQDGFASVSFIQENGVYVPESDNLRVIRGLTSPKVDVEHYRQCFRDMNSSFGVATDPQTGKTFEVAAVNLHVIERMREDPTYDGNAVLFKSTDFSSLSQNIGNAVELAGKGGANQNSAIIYAAYAGNAWSSDMHGGDRFRYTYTGRLTKGTDETGYEPIDHMEAEWRAINNYFGITANRGSADRSGGRMLLGVMAAAEENTFKEAYLNGVPGLASEASYSDLSLLLAQTKSRKERRADDEYTPGKVTGATKQEALKLLPRIYEAKGHKAIIASTYARAPHNRWMNHWALKGHDNLDNLGKHAVFNDMMAVLMRHEAMLTLQINLGENDPSQAQKSLDACVRYGTLVMNHIPKMLQSESRGVEFLVGTGNTEAHTNRPNTRLAAERRAFRSVATFMRLVFSGKPDSFTVTAESTPEKVA